MIEKIVKLCGIGLLHEPLPSGAIQLKPVTLIYAENGRGKSTFAAICHSLSCGEVHLIQEKKTFGGSYTPEVHFRIQGHSFEFCDGQWTKLCPNILVFDEWFIEKNVCVGSRIEPVHRENLLEFALGEQGVRLKDEIDEINENINQINNRLRELKRFISQHRGPFSFEEFVYLQQDPDVDIKLEKIQQKLRDAENIETIRRRPLPKPICLPDLDIVWLENLLASSLETVAEEAERKVKEHITRNLDAYGEKWLRQGLGYLEKTTGCPFCGQDFGGSDLIKAYKQYFTEAYDNFKRKIEEALEKIKKDFGEDIWASIESNLKSNENAEGAWADRPDFKFPEKLYLNEIKLTFISLRNKVVNILKQKLSAPLSKISIPEDLYLAAEEYTAMQSKIESYNEVITKVRNLISQFIDSLETINKEDLQAEINRLEAKKRRFQSEVEDYCAEYLKLQEHKSRLESCKREKRKELNIYMEQLLRDYKDQINSILWRFNTGFKISKIEIAHVGGTPRTEYGLEIMGETISVTSQAGRAFSTTLSSGDRKTLALAFFLSRLKLDPDRSQRIVIIDDPISSLDIARRRATLEELVQLANECAQLIVLSHDPVFLKDLLERINKDHSIELHLRRCGNYSIFEECSIYRLCQDEYYKVYESLIKYLEEGSENNKSQIAENIRKYLEHNLRTRFPIELEKAKNLGDMIRRIRNSPESFGKLAGRLEDLSTLNEFSSRYSHLSSDRPLPPSDAELKRMVELALDIGRG